MTVDEYQRALIEKWKPQYFTRDGLDMVRFADGTEFLLGSAKNQNNSTGE